MTLLLSEDAYAGDAQFRVSVDGKQIGGIQTVTANHAAGQSQTFAILGSFGSGTHTVSVDFLNDAYGGSAGTDRNLYVNGASFAGTAIAGASLTEYTSGPQSFTFQGPAATTTPPTSTPPTSTPPATSTPLPPASATIGSGPDTLRLSFAEDAYDGDAQFVVTIDGVQVGGTQTVTASRAAGQSQSFDVLGSFGITRHTVGIVFQNDAYGGSPALDRNLYLTGGALNGQRIDSATLDLVKGGTQSFYFGTAAAVSTASIPTPTVMTLTPTGPAYTVSPTGSDSGDGSAAHPFLTLQHALAQMAAGSVRTLYLASGTYDVSSTIALGTAANGYTLLAASGATPVLRAVNGTTTILSLSGTKGATIHGLTFQNAAADPQGAALLLRGASGNTVSGNQFSGNAEAMLLVQSTGNTIDANTILNSAGSAIEAKDASDHNVFSNNVIDGVGAIGLSGGAFYLHGASYDTISNNFIQNTAGTGIAIEDFGYGTTTNVGNLITRNVLLNTSTSALSTDDGAIYILGRSSADLSTTVSMNFIKNVGNVNPNAHVEGIYLDDNASGVTVTSNIVAGAQSDATELHGGYNDHYTNNIFDLGQATRTASLIQQNQSDQPATIHPALSNTSFTGNIIVSQQTSPNNVWVYFDLDPVNVDISNNLYYNYSTADHTLPVHSGPVGDSSPVFGNPNFVASALGNYGIGTGSAASQIGFIPIDTSLIGPR